MIINHNREKLLNLIIYFAKNTKNCGKTKLFKLLYYADFRHFRETGKTITGLTYYTWEKGPVPKDLFFEMNKPKEDFKGAISFTKLEDAPLRILPRVKFDEKYFTKRELKIIFNVAYIFDDAKAKDIVKCTHLPNDPWTTTLHTKGKDKEIDYTLALDSSPESLPKEKYLELLKNNEFLKVFFS